MCSTPLYNSSSSSSYDEAPLDGRSVFNRAGMAVVGSSCDPSKLAWGVGARLSGYLLQGQKKQRGVVAILINIHM